jgi:tRNA(Ile)-lysidine synthase
MEAFVAAVARLCRTERLFDPTRGALVMVSGGQDSLALLHVLAAGRLGVTGPDRVRALHVNYRLRGAESDADEALVRGHCAALGVDLTVVDAPLDKRAGNLQARARQERRAAAAAVAAAEELPRIAVAHTLDDQVETMLYRLGRYGGLAALRGMVPAALPWVRPLLGVRRTETAAYCRAMGLTWAVDKGNDDPGYARTGLRSSVLPAWEAALPGAARAAARAAGVAAETAALLDEWVAGADRWAAPAVASGEPGAGGWAAGADVAAAEWSAARLGALPPALCRAFLHARLAALGGEVSHSLVGSVEALLRGGGTAAVDLGGGWKAVRAYDRLRFERRSAPDATPDRAPVRLAVPGSVRWGALRVTATSVERFRAPDPTVEAYLDADALQTVAGVDGLVVRGPAAGDRFHPLGADGGRALQDVLVDLRVPAEHRARVPLVAAGDRVIWVGGFSVAREGRISETTRRLVHLRLQGEETATPA